MDVVDNAGSAPTHCKLTRTAGQRDVLCNYPYLEFNGYTGNERSVTQQQSVGF